MRRIVCRTSSRMLVGAPLCAYMPIPRFGQTYADAYQRQGLRLSDTGSELYCKSHQVGISHLVFSEISQTVRPVSCSSSSFN